MEVMQQDEQNRDDVNKITPDGPVSVSSLRAWWQFFVLIGYWLDQRWNTSPWLLLTGFFVGFVGMFYNIWKQTRALRGKCTDDVI